MPELTDLSYVRALCENMILPLSKGFGQNFIVNPGLPKIVDASGVDKRYGVLGDRPRHRRAGPGSWQSGAAKVVSIEVDERLPPAGRDNGRVWTIAGPAGCLGRGPESPDRAGVLGMVAVSSQPALLYHKSYCDEAAATACPSRA